MEFLQSVATVALWSCWLWAAYALGIATSVAAAVRHRVPLQDLRDLQPDAWRIAAGSLLLAVVVALVRGWLLHACC